MRTEADATVRVGQQRIRYDATLGILQEPAHRKRAEVHESKVRPLKDFKMSTMMQGYVRADVPLTILDTSVHKRSTSPLTGLLEY